MGKTILRVARSLAAIISGYLVVAAGTTLAFEVALGGIGFYKSSWQVLAVASVAAFLSGLAGGYVAAWMGGRPSVLHALGVTLFIVADSTYVIRSGISSDPLWYDLLGAATLIVSAILGGYLRRNVSRESNLALPVV